VEVQFVVFLTLVNKSLLAHHQLGRRNEDDDVDDYDDDDNNNKYLWVTKEWRKRVSQLSSTPEVTNSAPSLRLTWCAEEGSDALPSTVLCTLLLSLFLTTVHPPGAGATSVLESRSTTAVPRRLRAIRT